MYFSARTQLKKHLIKVHKWSEEKASAARLKYGLNIERTRLSENERKSKIRTYKKKICPMISCQKVVRRMENHLKDVHQLSGTMYKKKLSEAILFTDGVNNKDKDLPCDVLVEKGLLHSEALEWNER